MHQWLGEVKIIYIGRRFSIRLQLACQLHVKLKPYGEVSTVTEQHVQHELDALAHNDQFLRALNLRTRMLERGTLEAEVWNCVALETGTCGLNQ